MTAVGIVVIASGFALIWSGMTGASITDAVSSVLSGRKSAKAAVSDSLSGSDALSPASPLAPITPPTVVRG